MPTLLCRPSRGLPFLSAITHTRDPPALRSLPFQRRPRPSRRTNANNPPSRTPAQTNPSHPWIGWALRSPTDPCTSTRRPSPCQACLRSSTSSASGSTKRRQPPARSPPPPNSTPCKCHTHTPSVSHIAPNLLPHSLLLSPICNLATRTQLGNSTNLNLLIDAKPPHTHYRYDLTNIAFLVARQLRVPNRDSTTLLPTADTPPETEPCLYRPSHNLRFPTHRAQIRDLSLTTLLP